MAHQVLDEHISLLTAQTQWLKLDQRSATCV